MQCDGGHCLACTGFKDVGPKKVWAAVLHGAIDEPPTADGGLYHMCGLLMCAQKFGLGLPTTHPQSLFIRTNPAATKHHVGFSKFATDSHVN